MPFRRGAATRFSCGRTVDTVTFHPAMLVDGHVRRKFPSVIALTSPYATVPEVPYSQYFRYFSNDVIKYFRRPGLRCGCSYIRASSSEQQSAQALIFAGHEGYYHNHVLIQRQRRQTFYPGGNPPRNWRYGK